MADTIEALVAALAQELNKSSKAAVPDGAGAPLAAASGMAVSGMTVSGMTVSGMTVSGMAASGMAASGMAASGMAESGGKRRYTVSDYPMLEKHGSEIRTPTGKTMDEITLDAALDGRISISDVRISKEMLEAQAQIAADAGKPAMGENLLRAAELTVVPDDEVIRMYDRLRPNRSTKAELDELALTLEQKYSASKCAQLVREAAEVYTKRGILRQN